MEIFESFRFCRRNLQVSPYGLAGFYLRSLDDPDIFAIFAAMNFDADDLETSEHKRSLPTYPDLNLRQIVLFNEIMGAGSQIEIAERYNNLSASTLSKDIKALKVQLNLSHIPDREFWDSIQAKELQMAFRPLLDAWAKFGLNDHERTLNLGAGGSILGFWVGKQAEEIRRACSIKLGIKNPSVYDVRLSCRSMSNREIFSSVASGALDIGIVRDTLLTHARAAQKEKGTVAKAVLGTVRYGIMVPDKLRDEWSQHNTNFTTTKGYLKEELSILNTGFFASVGPEGEFKEQLHRALMDAGIDIRVEFAYKSFPQIIPHLIAGTHFGLCPILDDWEAFVPNCTVYPLRILKDYNRKIALIWNKNLVKPWVPISDLKTILRWPKTPRTSE